jgi:ectoine hydroxylase-related dioxygenase (phytanoyl-CoA dioxygenase family)
MTSTTSICSNPTHGSPMAADDLARHAQEIQSRGYTIIHNVLDAEQIAAAKAAVTEIYTREDPIAEPRGWKNHSWRITYILPQKHALFRQLPLNPRLVPLMRGVLGNDCVISNMNALTILPCSDGQRLHKDNDSLPGYPLCINALHAIDPFTRANGCTRLVPNSQQRAGYRDVEGDRRFVQPGDADPMETDAVFAEMPAGSVLAYDGGLWHAGSRNQTGEPRRGLHFFYSRACMRPTYDFARSISPEVAAAMTPEQRAIFGLHLRQPWYDWRTDTRRTD